MAKAAKGAAVNVYRKSSGGKLGRHTKSESKNKRSKNYKKPYRGQGK